MVFVKYSKADFIQAHNDRYGDYTGISQCRRETGLNSKAAGTSRNLQSGSRVGSVDGKLLGGNIKGKRNSG